MAKMSQAEWEAQLQREQELANRSNMGGTVIVSPAHPTNEQEYNQLIDSGIKVTEPTITDTGQVVDVREDIIDVPYYEDRKAAAPIIIQSGEYVTYGSEAGYLRKREEAMARSGPTYGAYGLPNEVKIIGGRAYTKDSLGHWVRVDKNITPVDIEAVEREAALGITSGGGISFEESPSGVRIYNPFTGLAEPGVKRGGEWIPESIDTELNNISRGGASRAASKSVQDNPYWQPFKFNTVIGTKNRLGGQDLVYGDVWILGPKTPVVYEPGNYDYEEAWTPSGKSLKTTGGYDPRRGVFVYAAKGDIKGGEVHDVFGVSEEAFTRGAPGFTGSQNLLSRRRESVFDMIMPGAKAASPSDVKMLVGGTDETLKEASSKKSPGVWNIGINPLTGRGWLDLKSPYDAGASPLEAMGRGDVSTFVFGDKSFEEGISPIEAFPKWLESKTAGTPFEIPAIGFSLLPMFAATGSGVGYTANMRGIGVGGDMGVARNFRIPEASPLYTKNWYPFGKITPSKTQTVLDLAKKPKTKVIDLTGVEPKYDIGYKPVDTVKAPGSEKLRQPYNFDLYDYPVKEGDAIYDWLGYMPESKLYGKTKQLNPIIQAPAPRANQFTRASTLMDDLARSAFKQVPVTVPVNVFGQQQKQKQKQKTSVITIEDQSYPVLQKPGAKKKDEIIKPFITFPGTSPKTGGGGGSGKGDGSSPYRWPGQTTIPRTPVESGKGKRLFGFGAWGFRSGGGGGAPRSRVSKDVWRNPVLESAYFGKLVTGKKKTRKRKGGKR